MRKWNVFIVVLIVLLTVTGCGKAEDTGPLNPDKPITVTVWHYYNGGAKEAFDNLVTEFNETVGMEEGIVIDAQSQGSVTQLAEAVFDAANESIGAAPLPNIFASYPDNAIRVHQIAPLVSLDTYFSEEELGQYRQEFLDEGRFITDDKAYIMPIAKSSENLYVNKTFWDPFAEAHGFTASNLETWEGIYDVAKTYYEETGKSFFSLDANANFFIITSMQLGGELYEYSKDATARFKMSEEHAKYLWDYYYRPSIKGYFTKTGRFSSDDAKAGSVLSYTGSTAGAAYFPSVVALSDTESYNIQPTVLPYPYFEGRKKVSIQQGAGMCITTSDEPHEYGAAVFLKWFTDTPQNLKFAVSTGYFPVKEEALSESLMLSEAEKREVPVKAIMESIKASNIMFNEYELYNSKSFKGSYEIRVMLESNILDKVSADRIELESRIASGDARQAVIDEFLSDEAFDKWYADLQEEAELILTNAGKE